MVYQIWKAFHLYPATSLWDEYPILDDTVRKRLGVTQRNLALTAGTGLRFIIELEKGKPTCQIGKILQVLGIQVNLSHAEIESEKPYTGCLP